MIPESQRHLPSQYRQILLPRSHGRVVLLGHDPHNLRDVREIMHHPSGQQLMQLDIPQGWVGAVKGQLVGPQFQASQRLQIVPPQRGELLQ